MMGRCSMPTGHWYSHAPQVVHWKTASWSCICRGGVLSDAGPNVIEVAAHAEDDFFGVEHLAGVGGGAVLGAAAALDAGVGLQADELREVRARDKAEVFIAGERRDLAEAAAGEKDGGRAQHQMQVLGVGNDGQKDEQGTACAPTRGCACAGLASEVKNAARYVTIRAKISSAMTPDS